MGCLVLCHTRELAYQICNEFERFSRYVRTDDAEGACLKGSPHARFMPGLLRAQLPDIKTKVFYGGVPVAEHKRILKSECPHIIVGTPGRMLQLVREKELLTKGIKHFILDECAEPHRAQGPSRRYSPCPLASPAVGAWRAPTRRTVPRCLRQVRQDA